MKNPRAFLLAAIFSTFVFGEVLAGDYVVISRGATITTGDEIDLHLIPGDCLRFAGTNDTKSYIDGLAGTARLTFPWHDVKIVTGTSDIEARYNAMMARLNSEYDSAVAQRDAQNRREALRAAAAAEYANSPEARIEGLERRLAATERAVLEAEARGQQESKKAARRAASRETMLRHEQQMREWQHQREIYELEHRLRD